LESRSSRASEPDLRGLALLISFRRRELVVNEIVCREGRFEERRSRRVDGLPILWTGSQGLSSRKTADSHSPSVVRADAYFQTNGDRYSVGRGVPRIGRIHGWGEMKSFDDHISELRAAYMEAPPRLRLRVALDRVRNPSCGPNRLIQTVSAVEGLARALVIDELVAQGTTVQRAYDDVQFTNASELVEKCLGDPKHHLAAEQWDDFRTAIKYRNILVHECTFLRQGYSERFIAAASDVFDVLAAMARNQNIRSTGNE